MKISWSKFAGIKKLPAQKSPSRFTAIESEASRKAKIRSKFGDLPEYMGLSQRSVGELAAESYAMKAENKMFFRTLRNELKASRSRTAGGVKSMRSVGKEIKPRSLKVAKSKGAMKAYQSAESKSKKAFSTIMERYTGRSKSSTFKKSVELPSNKPYSLDTREVQYLKKIKRDWGY